MYPEEGRSAIAAAARAIADFRLGRLDEETTASVGLIEGGSALNIVPEHCSFQVDVRSIDERKLDDVVQELLEVIAFAASLTGCAAETDVQRTSDAYRFRRSDPAIGIACAALEQTGYVPRLVTSGGRADANVFNERGRSCVNLGNGMIDIHTREERIAVADLDHMVDVTLALIDVARETPA
jgi:tripeptide aminopeptidase